MDELSTYALITLVTCATPGAAVLNTLSCALNSTSRQAWRAPLGDVIGMLIMGAVTAAGLGGIIAANATLYEGLRLIGALLLVWFGVKSWKAGRINVMHAARVHHAADKDPHVMRNAVLLQATNPMLIVFLISLLPQFLSANDPQYVLHMSELIGVFAAICLCVHLAYSYTAVFARKMLSGPNFSVWLNRVSAILFWMLAAGVVRSLC